MPADAYALPENVPPLDVAEDAVRDGLPAERERLAAARANDDFYQFRNCKHLEQRPDETEEEFDERPKRYSRITRTVVRKLAEPLYNPGPTRVVQSDASLSAWLEEAYEAASLNTRMQSADRAATLNHVAALQIEPTGDPRRPLRYWLWKGHEFAVFTRDGDPINPWAVCTIEQIPAGPESPGKLRTRYRLWSAFERRTFLTKPWGQRDTAGGRVAELVERLGPDEYPFPGVLPFVFVRNEPAETDFWDGGIGDALREANMEADRRLSNLAEHVEAFLNPFGWARGVPATATLARKVGRFTHLPTDPMARQGDNNIPPEVGYLQGQLGVEAAWYDLKAFLDSTLEDLEVPLTVVRSDASTDLSGVAIEKKTVPLLHRTRARQPQFSETESELAAKSLAVAAAWYGAAGWNLAAKAAAAAREPKLLCVWPEPRVIDSTSREGLDTLRAEMELGMTDGFEVMARLRGTTIEKAMVMARDTAQRQRLWAQLMGLDQADGQQGGQEDGQGGKQPPPDAEDEPTNDPED